MRYVNESILRRFDELIPEGERLWDEFKKNNEGMIIDIVAFTQWATSCLNLLDKLSITTNRFVTQFEIWVTGGPGKKMNIGAALGVLKSARHEYLSGMAVEYHLSVSAAVFGGLEAIAKMRNDAAHGGEFNYSKIQIEGARVQVESMLRKLLGNS